MYFHDNMLDFGLISLTVARTWLMVDFSLSTSSAPTVGGGGLPGLGDLPLELLVQIMQDPQVQALLLAPGVINAMQACMSDPSNEDICQNNAQLRPILNIITERLGLGDLDHLAGA